MAAHTKPKVLMIAFELPPFNSGGLGVACLGLTKALAKMGYDITFLLPKKLSYPYNHMKFIFADEMLSKAVRAKSKLLLSKEKEYISTYDKRRLSEIAELNFDEIADLMAKRAVNENFDIIHAHDWMTFAAAVKIKQATGKKLVVQIHSTEVDRSPLESIDPHKYGLEKHGMENADVVIAVSKYTKEIIHKFYGIPLEKIAVVYNASDLPEIEQSQKLSVEGPLILYLGRITHQKGPNHLLEIAQKVVNQIPTAKFVVVGDGDMYEEMVNNAAARGLSGNIIFAGFLRGLEKEMVLNSCSLFVMPSLSEPFGIVALEAAHFGMPVLVSRQSGACELLRGAIVADFWDTELMANQIVNTVTNNKMHQKLTKILKEDLQKINWESSAQQCEEAYSII